VHINFNEIYAARSGYSVAMVVANAVQGDSRVIKTAATLSKLGFCVYLFGMSKTDHDETLEGYPFSVELVANPAYKLKAERRWLEACGQRDIPLFIDTLTDHIAQRMGGRRFDILHTHDMYGLPIGAKLKKKVLPSSVMWIHDLHEYVEGCTNIDEHVRSVMWKFEQEHIHETDALTTVSPILVQLITKNYGVPEPGLVLNAPRMADYDPWYPNPIRKALRLDDDVPLLVYNGNVKPERGVQFAVEALGLLPNVHLALITNSKGAFIDELWGVARRYNASERLHVHPYVPNTEVTSFLRNVNAGINPVTLYQNSDLALPNKVFEYIHSGTPIVSTATEALSDFLACHHCGVTFPGGNVSALADAVNRVFELYPLGLPSVAHGSELAREYCWEEQEKVLLSVYDRLLNKMSNADENTRSRVEPIVHLPSFAANQPFTLANALCRTGNEASCVSLTTNRYGYSCDHMVKQHDHSLNSIESYFVDEGIGRYQTYHFHSRPLVYRGDFSFPTGIDLLLLKAMGKSVFFHFRGSEIRLNRLFRTATPYNYADEQDKWSDPKKPFVFNEDQQVAFRDFVQGVCDGVFVNDAELQCYVPNALIVPRAVEIQDISMHPIALRERPLIVHAPSRRGVKGTAYVLSAVDQLQKEGYVFDFKLVEDMAHAEAMDIYRKATIIIDQLRIGWYGVVAVEGMAMGKAVVSYIRSDLRHYLPHPTPLAIANPENIVDVLRYLLETPEAIAQYGEVGRIFAQEYHEAQNISKVLMNIYKRPFRPIDSVAVSAFLAWQTQKLESKSASNSASTSVGMPASKLPFKKRSLASRYYSTLYYINKFFYIIKNQGLKVAFRKAINKLK
jgi:glycosyltransferase involved in cell wall biosynthesis